MWPLSLAMVRAMYMLWPFYTSTLTFSVECSLYCCIFLVFVVLLYVCILLVFLKYCISRPRAWMKQGEVNFKSWLELNQATGSMIVHELSDNCHPKLLHRHKFTFTFVPILSTWRWHSVNNTTRKTIFPAGSILCYIAVVILSWILSFNPKVMEPFSSLLCFIPV